MREERGHLIGDQTISEAYTLWGSVAGNVTATKGSKLYIRGSVYGDLTVLYGGRVHVFGTVSGMLLVKDGAKVILSGMVGHDAVNEGGRLYLDASAQVKGKLIRTEDGETQIDKNAIIEG